jgi:uncharacterized protein involved in exopolysaccharide biosynthesis
MTSSDENRTAAEDLSGAWKRFRDAMARRRRAFVTVAVVTFLVIQGVGFFWPATFAAQAAILIQKSRSSTPLDTDPTRGSTVISGGVTEEEVNSEIAILTSREVLAATVEAAGLDRVPQPWYLRLLFLPLRAYDRVYASYHKFTVADDADRAIQSLGKSISAERLKSSNVVVITLEARDPKAAEVVLAELLKIYVRHHTEVHFQNKVAPVFSGQAEEIQKRLEELRGHLQQAKHQAGTVDAASERDVQLKIDASLREEADTLRRRLAELDAKLGAFDRERNGSGARASVGGQILDELKSEVNRLELEQVKMESRYRDGFPLLEENKKKLERTRQALKDESSLVFEHNPTLVALEHDRANAAAERAGVARRLAVLDKQVGASRERLLGLDEQTSDAERSKLELRALEDRYLMYLSRGEQARIDSALDESRLSNASIVQAAASSPKPVRPKKSVLLLVSIAGGLLTGLLGCAWMELRAVGLAAILAAIAPPARP